MTPKRRVADSGRAPVAAMAGVPKVAFQWARSVAVPVELRPRWMGSKPAKIGMSPCREIDGQELTQSLL
jgi:hypothetical protein